METPQNAEPTEHQPSFKQRLKLFWQKTKALARQLWQYINIVQLLENLFAFVSRIMLSFEGVTITVFLLTFGLSAYGIINNYVRLTSAMGLFWLFLLLGLFMLTLLSKQSLTKEKEKIDLDIFNDDKHWFLHLLKYGLRWIMRGLLSALNTIMGFLIMTAYLVTELHVSAATGDFQLLWQKDFWSWPDVFFIILAPLSGIIYDLYHQYKKIRKPGGITFFFGITGFFLSFIFLITGLIGGEDAVLAIDYIVYNPIEWLFVELPNAAYEQSSAYAIISNMGFWPFLLFYCFVPINFIAFASIQIDNHRSYQPTKISMGGAKALLYFNLAFLLIVLYVAWQQGWIGHILEWLVYIVVLIVQLLGKFFDWLFSLFNG